MTDYFRPLVQTRAARPAGAVTLAGASCWFTHVEHLRRDATPRIVEAGDVPAAVLERLSAPRPEVAGLAMDRPHVMGILNTTPDSFSDGGVHHGRDAAAVSGSVMVSHGATILDIGGESTRPGAAFVPADEEIARVVPVIERLGTTGALISIDTRKAEVARAALAAGAGLVNDVSGFTFDADLAPLCAEAGVPVCVMHMQGDPQTMQDDPQYEDVLLDVYDFLAAQVSRLVGMGIARERIIVDPGIGFGKTQAHNLTLLRGLSLFHGLGCPILLGVSRKGFIGRIGREPQASARAPGSIAVGLAGLAQGVQILRVHDVAETMQAVRLWQAVQDPESEV
ncbi:dihydropteroate synthase [Lutimaribacter marinistellae]|uniref:Dihydropteroate synthase n=1 Tax=Lutimaribacter marinistellae TaxID=1820329 RepID=A0ABV7TIZ1_9RHOB